MTARWTRTRRALLCVAALLACLVLATLRAFLIDFPVERVPADPTPAAIASRVDTVLDRYVGASRFSGVVLVAVGDDLVVERAFGSTGLGTSITPTTRFTFGSIAKPLTGWLMQRLAARGTVHLDAAARSFLPELEGTPVGAVTIDQLLHMTSGLPGSMDLATFADLQTDRGRWWSDAELLAVVRDYDLAFEPGTRFEYSNVGFRLLAMIASRATGTRWPELLRREVFEPAGMSHAAVFDPETTPPADLALGRLPYRCYVVFGEPCLVTLPRWNYSALWGAGAVHGRASDYLSFGRFLARAMREEPATFEAYTRPVLDDYGAGIGNRTIEVGGERVRVYSHSGEDPGYYGYFAYVPSLDATLVVMSNSDYGMTSNYDLGYELRAAIIGAEHDVVASE